MPRKGGSIFLCRGNLAATNLLGKPLKGFIVNPTNLPRKGVKRLATSGKRVNHDSYVSVEFDALVESSYLVLPLS